MDRESKIAAFAAVWLAAAGVGVGALWAYSERAGAAGTAAALRPAETDPTRPTLTLFVHPRCPCSRAALDELAWIMTRARGRLAVEVYFYRPEGAASDWEKTSLWRTAAALGAAVSPDDAGKKALSFGAMTSGMAYLYDPSGRLLFRGGITAGRGHEGDNPGRRAVLEALEGKRSATLGPVFGCMLSAAAVRAEGTWKWNL